MKLLILVFATVNVDASSGLLVAVGLCIDSQRQDIVGMEHGTNLETGLVHSSRKLTAAIQCDCNAATIRKPVSP